ncbi:hypothetical protein N5876_32320 (plasmid) [Pseudomonas aeruginosa]|uniref:helix-turn-helix transcriptional regulator n=1 Tax=Pseudomonas aeruginosa TaxID=287 RepID=UPI0021BFF89A|nr:hypothetical protein [Pseudomonas aeruginosa]UXH55960.1 hypothetical protein N5876_32320 [Pseudomonas aeruginosa]UXH68916.1 hypothetical protein N5879_32625 [Pseudomonas aeruginosa]
MNKTKGCLIANFATVPLCKGKARVTIDTALILGKAFGTGPDYWLELQQAVDIWDALHSEKRKERLESIVPLMKMVAA